MSHDTPGHDHPDYINGRTAADMQNDRIRDASPPAAPTTEPATDPAPPRPATLPRVARRLRRLVGGRDAYRRSSSSRDRGDVMTSTLRASTLLLAGALAVTACETSQDAEADPSEAAADGVVEIEAHDYAFTGVPETLEAGTELQLTNGSSEEVHELVLTRLPGDEERSIEEIIEQPRPEVEGIVMGGLAGVSVAPPGATGNIVEGELMVDEPGRYALLCFIPTGADPGEYMAAAQESQGPPQVDGGPPHIFQGMHAEILVE